MEEAKGELKNVSMAKFKAGTSESQVEQLIQTYANLVSVIEPMKSFRWGKKLSIEKQDEGYTHVFETTFESVEGIAEYSVHPAHHDYAKQFLPTLVKLCFIAAPDEQIITLKNPAEIQALMKKVFLNRKINQNI